MQKSFGKDILRSIAKSKKRFLSLLVITALGVTMFCAIYAACQDIYSSADRFYDNQRLFDIRIRSTLGLTDEDVAVLRQVPDVEAAEGGYSETVHTLVEGARKTADMAVLSSQGMNMPYVTAGRLPQHAGEIAVTQKYLNATGKSIGAALSIEEDKDNDDNEEDTADTVTAAEDDKAKEILNPTDPLISPAAETTPAEDSAGDNSDFDTDVDTNVDTDVNWDTNVDVEDDEETPTFANTTYTITGVVIDPMNISNNDATRSFRSTASTDYNFYITPADADTDIYTSVSLAVRGLSSLDCNSAAYEDAVQAVIDRIETQMMKQRQQARYDAVIGEARGKIEDAETTMREKFAEADQKFADAWTDITDGKQKLQDGTTELNDKEQDALDKIAKARAKLSSSKKQLTSAGKKLDAGQKELTANVKKLKAGKQELDKQRKTAEAGFADAEKKFKQQQAKLDASGDELKPQIEQLKAAFGDAWPKAAWGALVNAAAEKTAALIAADPTTAPDAKEVAAATTAQQNALAAAIAAPGIPQLTALTPACIQAALGMGMLDGSQQALDAQKAAFQKQKDAALKQLSDAETELAQNEAKLTAAQKQLDENRAKVEKGWASWNRGVDKLDKEEAKAQREIDDAWQKIADNQKKLNDGETTLKENEQTYKEKKTDAEQKVADAYAKLSDIDMTQWYVQSRTSLDSYSAMKNEMSSIEALGRIFPLIFIVVAILISLTTMTRMVEEERGLIGTYKALGLSNGAIYVKYLVYALLASLVGGALGNFLGFVVLPNYLLQILKALYTIPYFDLRYDAVYGVGGALLFVAATVGATALACHSELRHTPAVLLRPKAPHAGSRVLLERIPLIWNRLKFLNKVTARNLFRYKKRLIMTIAGIMGCTTLLMIGFTIRDTVTDLRAKQYENIYNYDLMVAVDQDDDDELTTLLDGEKSIADYLHVQADSVKVVNDAGDAESMQMMVVPDGADLGQYIRTPDREGVMAQLKKNGILITRNAAELLHLKPGDKVFLQNLQLEQHEAPVADIVENYLGNCVYITQSEYASLFGDYAPNAALAHFAPGVADPSTYVEGLLEHDFILASLSTATLKVNFAKNFAMMNSVIYLMIVLAAGLALVVLFTLSSTNISERIRELATIKVLGFYDAEVHSYVNKETLILTAIGILAGLPAGRLVSGVIISMLKIPAVNFAVTVEPLSYAIAGAISFVFALAVTLMTNRTLDKINMVEALKSVE